MLIYFFVFLAGIMQSAMQSFNGVLQGHIGLFGTSLMTHMVGGLLLILYITLIRRERIALGPMPGHLYFAGIYGLILVAGSSLCVSKIGPSLTACLNISGQLILSILMDHFQWMGVKQIRFKPRRLLCLAVILTGLIVVNFGGPAKGTTDLIGHQTAIYGLLSFCLGGVNVYSRAVNFQATKYLGTANGTLMNYIIASILSVPLLFGLEPEAASLSRFTGAPLWLYLGGVFGVLALVINVISLKKINLFQSTSLLLTGQLAGSSLLDAVLFQNMTLVKFLGVCVVALGVIWDKKISMAAGQ